MRYNIFCTHCDKSLPMHDDILVSQEAHYIFYSVMQYGHCYLYIVMLILYGCDCKLNLLKSARIAKHIQRTWDIAKLLELKFLTACS